MYGLASLLPPPPVLPHRRPLRAIRCTLHTCTNDAAEGEGVGHPADDPALV